MRSFESNFTGLESLRGLERPAIGWLRTVREASGISAGELGRRLGVSRQLPLQFERAEAADTITLKSLRAVAAALGCELVYVLAPRAGSLQALAESRSGTRHASAATPPEPATWPQSVPREERTSALDDRYFCD